MYFTFLELKWSEDYSTVNESSRLCQTIQKQKEKETKGKKKVRTSNNMLHNCSREETGEGLTPSASVTEG